MYPKLTLTNNSSFFYINTFFNLAFHPNFIIHHYVWKTYWSIYLNLNPTWFVHISSFENTSFIDLIFHPCIINWFQTLPKSKLIVAQYHNAHNFHYYTCNKSLKWKWILKIKAILHPNDRKSMPSNVILQTILVIYYCKRAKQCPTNSKFMERLLLWHHIKPYEYTKLDHATIKIFLKANQISSHNKLLYFDYCMTKNIFIPSIYFELSKKKKKPNRRSWHEI